MNVSQALRSRMSCRAFLPDPVPIETVREILDLARASPSGGNLQPWHAVAVTGQKLQALVHDISLKMEHTPRGEPPEYRVYPKDLKEPYNSRRFNCGEDLYATIGVSRDDKAGRLRQFYRNYQLFGAPVGLFVFVDRTMLPPQWADLGIFIQSIMLAAREFDLHTCPQEAWAAWHATIAAHLETPPELMLFCGIALGKMDETAPINRLRTGRAQQGDIFRFLGFSDPAQQ